VSRNRQTDSPPIRVLYATGDESLPTRVESTLDPVDLRSEPVTTVTTALDAVDAAPVDCVVVTDSLPDADGLDLARAVREENPRLPIVLVTEEGTDERARGAAAAGVTYLPTTSGSDATSVLAERVLALAEQERERRNARRERDRLERTTRHLESLFESAPLPIIELDAEGMVLRWNRGAEETFGWASENAVGKFNPIVPEDELDAFDRLLNQLLAGEEVRGAEVVGQTNAGKRVEFLLSATPVSGPDGPQSVIAVLNDITTQERMERRLRELQETAQQLSVSPSIDTVGEIATEAANNVLGLGVTGLWRYDEREQALRPVTITTAAEIWLRAHQRLLPATASRGTHSTPARCVPTRTSGTCPSATIATQKSAAKSSSRSGSKASLSPARPSPVSSRKPTWSSFASSARPSRRRWSGQPANSSSADRTIASRSSPTCSLTTYETRSRPHRAFWS
jgi:PAS domain S-box-containing protein